MFKKRSPSIGARPGTLVLSDAALKPKIRLMQYSRDSVCEMDIDDPSVLAAQLSPSTVTWIDVQGLGDESVLRTLAQTFNIHPLSMEDVVNTPQRPKVDTFDDQQLIICRMVCMWSDRDLSMEQVSILQGPNFVVTFQEQHGDVLDPVRQRIRSAKSRLRQFGTDYLAYALLDTIIDAYYPALELLGEHLGCLEDAVLDKPAPVLLRHLIAIKNRLMNYRRIAWAQREMVRILASEDNPLITEAVRVFLRDTYDHCVQTSEVVEMYREMTTGLMNTYLSSVGQRTNEVMKVLTIVSSIFIPLTFVAGIYGMNFEHMPELSLRWAYPMVWLTMLTMVLGMVWFFRKQGWLAWEIEGGSDILTGRGKGPEASESSAQDALGLVLDHDIHMVEDARRAKPRRAEPVRRVA